MSNIANNNKVKDKIQKWLLDEGYKIQTVPNEKASFAIMATDSQDIKTQIIQPKGKDDLAVIVAGITFSEEQQSALKNKEVKERTRILWEMRFGLLNMGVGFGGITVPIKNIQVSTHIYHDGLNKNAFMEKIAQVKRAVLFVLWSINKELGEIKPQLDSSGIV